MAVSPARAAAFDILLRVEQQDAYASELLHSPRFAKLSPQDHGLTTELVMGVLRWRSLLDTEISSASSQKLEKLDIELVVPDANLVSYKEALIMAFIGVLRWRQEFNVLSSVTGASRNSIGGVLWTGEEA